jgi:hypothetical protein
VAIPLLFLIFITWTLLIRYNKHKREANEPGRLSSHRFNDYDSSTPTRSLAQAGASNTTEEDMQQVTSDNLSDSGSRQSIVDEMQQQEPIHELDETINQEEYLPPASEGDLDLYNIVHSSPLITHSEGAYHTRAYAKRAGASRLQSPDINDSSPVSRGYLASPDVFTPNYVPYSTPLTVPTSPPNQRRLKSQSPISPSRHIGLYRAVESDLDEPPHSDESTRAVLGITIPAAISTIVDAVISPIRSAVTILSLASPTTPLWNVAFDGNTHQSPVRRGKTPIPIRGFVRGAGEMCMRCNRIHTYPIQGIDEILGCMSADEHAELLAIQEEEHLERMERRSERIAAQRAARAKRVFL